MPGETKVTHGGQGHQNKGHGQVHGHGNRRPARKERVVPTTQDHRQQRTSTTTKKPSKAEEINREHDKTANGQRNEHNDVNEDDVSVMKNGEEQVMMTRHDLENGETGGKRRAEDEGTQAEREGDREGDREVQIMEEREVEIGKRDELIGMKTSEERRKGGSQDWNDNKATDDDSSAHRLTEDPTNYDVSSFNTNLSSVMELLSDRRFSEMSADDDYPVEELMSVISLVTMNINEYFGHSQQAQHQLHELRDTMKTVKENLHLSISRQPLDLSDDEPKSPEVLELEAKLASLNAVVAEAHTEVAEARRITAETEQVALQASLAAEKAKEEAEKIKEEIRLKEEVERKKKEEKARKRQEEERQRVEEERKKAEEVRAKEEARKKAEEERTSSESYSEDKSSMENWAPLAYAVDDGTEGGDLKCVMRGNPATFKQNEVICETIKDSDAGVTYGEQEELISKVIELKPANDNKPEPTEPIYVTIPYGTRLPGSREPVIKAFMDGNWVEIPTQETALDGYKEYRFAQAKVSQYTKLLVMSRFKRDYLHVQYPKRPTKLSSTYDQRVSLNVEKNTFAAEENLVLQVQPVDSNTISEFRAMDPAHKSLLTSSPILHMVWDTPHFAHPINITVPCPPNPAKAKKMALLKKQKEDKLAQPAKPVVNMDEKKSVVARPQKAATAKGEDSAAEAAPAQKATKWYMGQYGQTEDDENDKLSLMAFTGGRWTCQPEIEVKTVKVDLVTFDIDTAFDKVVVFRTRVDTEEDALKQLVKSLTEQLSRRSVKILIKQRAEDPYDACCNVVPTAVLERAEKQMKADGYTDGPDKCHSANVKEGDAILLTLRGNLKFNHREDTEINLVYNSNLPTQASFHVIEIDRYLQRNYEVYRGAVRVQRRYPFEQKNKMRRTAEEEAAAPAFKCETICDVEIEIPKYHVEPDPIPKRVSVVIHEAGPVDKDSLKQLAAELGEEWQRLGDKLHVNRVRQQAILRTVIALDQGEETAKYEMLVTWLKRCPQAADKLNTLVNALAAVGREDLANHMRTKSLGNVERKVSYMAGRKITTTTTKGPVRKSPSSKLSVIVPN
ncbi:uncharacterized protein [Littorina saxatilis]|uniref:Death domain-containing protein n=1 Tax=Littorina saxatilis TaxID=31220 RepID=A0AAN9B191_9CAEN